MEKPKDPNEPHKNTEPQPGPSTNDEPPIAITQSSKSATSLDKDDPGKVRRSTNELLEDSFVTRHMLYKEAMYTSVHFLGRETEKFPCNQEKMCVYVHEAFSISPKEQQEVVDHVKNELVPLIGVNTRIIKGEEIGPDSRNPNSYCVIAIVAEGSVEKMNEQRKSKSHSLTKGIRGLFGQSTSKTKLGEESGAQFYDTIPTTHKTVVKPHERNPIWDQTFQCTSLTPSKDTLTVEVWDRLEDDSLKKSIDAYAESHKITQTTKPDPPPPTTSKKGDVFLGKVSKTVHEISCEGYEKTMPLENVTDSKSDVSSGKLRLRIWLVHLYRHGKSYVDVVDKRTMLSCLWDWILSYEIKRNGPNWDGELPSEAHCLLYQYALQTGISEDTASFIRSHAYSKHKLGGDGIIKPLKDLDQILPTSIEDAIMALMEENIFPIIRNHLHEPESQVSKALKAYLDCENVLKKNDLSSALPNLRGQMEKALRLCFLEWYQATYALRVQNMLSNSDACQKVKLRVELMMEVNNLLAIGIKKWHPEFWMLAQYETYMPVMYDELQKMVNYDIEMFCVSLHQSYNNNGELRKILKSDRKQDECTVSALFSLYVGTQTFVDVQEEIFPNEKPSHYKNLDNYYEWFRPVLVLWLGFAVIRGSDMITRCVNIDNVSPENSTAKTSTSALDTATVIHQLVHFWEKLMWPDISEKYVIIHFLIEVMCYFTVLYAERKHEKLEMEGYFDTEGQFDISERLCIALNNIEYVKEAMEGVTEEIKYEQLIKDLEAACGVTKETKNYRKRLKQVYTFSIGTVELIFTRIMKGVGQRIQPEIKRYVRDSLAKLQTLPNSTPSDSETLQDAMDPVFSYVDSNIVTLSQSLLTLNFARMLQLFWNTILQELHPNEVLVQNQNENEGGVALASKIILVIPILRKYFGNGDTGLNENELNTPIYLEVSEALNQYVRRDRVD